MIKKFNPKYLEKFCKTQCRITLYKEGLSEEGEPKSFSITNKKCRFVEKSKVIIDAEGKKVELVGLVVFAGDIAPELKKISGEVIIKDCKYYIYSTRRPRNPDGSVYYTALEVM